MCRVYIAEKKLRDGGILKIETWISDTVHPGKRMHRLEYERNKNNIFHYPFNLKDLISSRVWGLYHDIHSERDFFIIFRRN